MFVCVHIHEIFNGEQFSAPHSHQHLGGLICVSAGVLVHYGSPIVIYSAVEIFYGLGGALFLGSGTALMGRSPNVADSAVINRVRDYWIAGSCEPYENAWASGPLRWYGLPHTEPCLQPKDGGAWEPPEEGEGEGASGTTAVEMAGSTGKGQTRAFKVRRDGD